MHQVLLRLGSTTPVDFFGSQLELIFKVIFNCTCLQKFFKRLDFESWGGGDSNPHLGLEISLENYFPIFALLLSCGPGIITYL